jgi:hypothetical protein
VSVYGHLLSAKDQPLLDGRDTLLFFDALLDAGYLETIKYVNTKTDLLPSFILQRCYARVCPCRDPCGHNPIRARTL